MISWMQRHKKWLIVTIWISTIAFVGAGFVGWGSYNYGQSSGNIAVVGKQEVKMSDLQAEYNVLYNKYQNAFGEMFNQEMAKQFKLEDAAFNSVIQKFLLLNYAKELGFHITDKEVAQYLIEIPSFRKDNKFDKNTYITVLKRNKTTPTEFEEQIKKDLLVSKVQLVLNTNVTKTEITNLSVLNTIEDKVSIKIINSNKFKFDKSEKAIKKYWEANKDNYKSLKSINISYATVKIGDKKKESKKEALKEYLKLKKGDLKFEKAMDIDTTSEFFTPENFQKISTTGIGSILKPFENNSEFIIVKVNKFKQPQALSFKEALESAKSDFIFAKKEELLNKEIQKVTTTFNGKDIGFVSLYTNKDIKGLDETESSQLVKHIFGSQTTINSVILNASKAVVYKITDSKLSTPKSKETAEFEAILKNIKNNEAITTLLKKLKNKYDIVSNMKAN